MKYKFSLITIAFLAFNLNATGINTCVDNVRCNIDSLDKNTVLDKKNILVTGKHTVSAIQGTDSEFHTNQATNLTVNDFVFSSSTPVTSNTQPYTSLINFDGDKSETSSNININNLNISNSRVQMYKTFLTIQNATFTGSYIRRDSRYGGTNIKNLTLDNSIYDQAFSREAGNIETLIAKNNSVLNLGDVQSANLNIKNIINSNNLSINVNKGTLSIENIALSANSPTINQIGGVLNFNGGGIINNAIINVASGTVNANNTTLNNVAFDKQKGDMNISNAILNDTMINTSGGSTSIINSKVNNGNIDMKDTAGYLWLEGKVDFNGTNITKQSSKTGSHNVVVKNNSVINFNDTNLSNLSINANSVNDKASYVNIKGGNLTNTSIGTVKGVVNGIEVLLGMSHLTLDDVNIDNSALSADKNIIAEHLAIKNIDGATKNIKANISVDKDLLIDNAVLDTSTNILSGETIATNSTINGVIVADTLKSNQTNFVGKVHTGDIVSTNSTFQNAIVTGDINDNGSSFNGTVSAVSVNAQGSTFANTVDALSVNANGATFKQDVNINCTNQAGFTCTPSVVKDTKFETSLTLGGNTNITLDNSSSVNNLTLEAGTTVAVNGASAITGTINNDGVIKLNNGTISEAITGSGDLYTFKVTYDKAVESSDVKGSNSTFNNTVKATDSMVVDNATFNSTVTVENATNNANLYAYQGNEFKADVIADNAFLRYDSTKDSSKGNQITIDTSLTANNNLNINDITVKAKELKSDLANISNSTINSKLTGKNDTSTTVYASGALSGEYNINNSDITGGIRVKDLKISGSKIKSQIIVDTLEATNNTFYVFGGGTNTSFYDYYSGAIIVKKGAIGSGNTIQLSNTNLGLLINGFVPIAIVKDDSYVAPPVTGPITMALNTTATGGGEHKQRLL